MKITFSQLKNGYDVVVIGGGAAGCSFLNHLSTEKYNTLLVDYRPLPRFKACSGILVKNAKDYFAEEVLPIGICAYPKELHLTYQDWTHNLEKQSKKYFVNTHRKNLDAWLFSKIENELNVSISDNTKLIDFFYTKDKQLIVLMLERNGETKPIVTKYLIGCDGALSTVRRKLFKKDISYYVAMQEIIPGAKIDNAYFIFDDEITDFYGWLIPKDDAVEVGAAVPPFKAKERFDLFKTKVAKKFGIEGQGKLESAIVLRPDSIKKVFLGQDSVFLAGEAAALISPSSAEGISYALLSGKYCAEVLNANLPNPMKKYKEKCKPLLDRLSEKFSKSKKISNANDRKSLFFS